MIERNRDHLARQLSDYLDGRLTGRDLELFELRVAREPSLAEEVQRQAAIEDALRRRLEPPPVEGVLERIERAREERRVGPDAAAAAIAPVAAKAAKAAAAGGADHGLTKWMRRVRPLYAGVAAITLVGLGALGWMVNDIIQNPWGASTPPAWSPYGGGYAPYPGDACGVPGQTADEVYRATVAAGFKPAWVCGSDAEMMRTFEKRLGQRLVMRETGDVKMVGLSYGIEVPGESVVLLARAQSRGVLVFIDRQGAASLHVNPASGLHLFERRIGSLVLREVSPLDHPTVVNQMQLPVD